MDTHVFMSAVPIKILYHMAPHGRQGDRFGRHKDNGVPFAFDRSRDRHLLAVPFKGATVTGLPPACRVQQAGIQHDTALFGMRDYVRPGVALVRVFAKQHLGHRSPSPFAASFRGACTAAAFLPRGSLLACFFAGGAAVRVSGLRNQMSCCG